MEGPVLILAGPGSGKTRTLTYRIAYLLEQGIPAQEILALTFTNKAAEEMLQRLKQLVGDQPVWMGTFHRFCARLLRRYASAVGLDANYSIYDASDSRQVLKRVIQREQLDLVHLTPERVIQQISMLKNNCVLSEGFEPRPGDPLDAIIAKIYPAYQQQLTRANAVDFDDLLLHVYALLRENAEIRTALDLRYKYVLVDEYQDTNLAQYAIARGLSINEPNLCVVGDPDQSIYGWRGANIKNILEFEKDFPQVRVVRLEQNYRSTQRILRVAGDLISHNKQRKQKDLFSENAEGGPVRWTIYPSEQAEAEAIADLISQEVNAGRRLPSDFAVLYRLNALSLKLEIALRQRKIPYQIVQGVEFFQREEVKDLLAYLHLLNNPRDDLAFQRIINRPARKIGAKTVQRIRDYADEHKICLLDAAQEIRQIPKVTKAAVQSVSEFVAMFQRLSAVLASPVEEIVGRVLTETKYTEQFGLGETPEEQEKLANVQELLSMARDFDEQHHGQATLEEFLEQTSLVSETDALGTQENRVKLLTLHAAKGLEFPIVFLIALEEGLLPHEWSKDRPEGIEEERRLLFVGITRAMHELYLSQAQYRQFRGIRKMTVPSQFVQELPREDLEHVNLSGQVWTDDSSQLGPDDDFPAIDVREDFEVDQSEPVPRSTAKNRKKSSGKRPQLQTAAELAGQAKARQQELDVEVFHQDMLVKHPEYGLGKIIALSGSGKMRRATVRFASEAGEKKFVLANSPIEPVKSAQ